jgi:hypothetical protein
MAEENESQLPVEIEAALELELKPALKKGFASLRGVKRSTYMRRSLLKILTLSPEERAALVPPNGFVEIARNLVNAKGKDGAVAVAVWRECKETLGERIGSRWKESQEHAKGVPDIINDLPQPESKDFN